MADKRRDDKETPERQGDVLGLSDATKPIPRATTDRGGNPEGVEVREERTGTEHVKPGKGATAIDMGGAGEGHKVKR